MPGRPYDLTGRERFYDFAACLRQVFATKDAEMSVVSQTLLRSRTGLNGARRGDSLLSEDNFRQLYNWSELTETDRLILRLGLVRTWLRHPNDYASEIPAPNPPTTHWDFVGIGALNFDFVIPSSLSQPNGEVIKEGSLSGNEKKHSATKKDVDDEVADWLEHTNRTSLPIVRGGSAFNTTLTLTGMKMGLRTGFLGVSGTPPSGSDLLSHREVLRNAGSEWPFLPEAEAIVGKNSPEEARGGQCVSAMMGNLVERHMLTWPGANALLGRYILDALDAKRLFTIADHLSVARCVHVTTLLDEISADVVATLLEIVRSRSPLTLISFDPGYHWSRMPLDSVLRILRIADILFVSLDELDELVRTYCKTSTSRGEAKKAKLLQTQVARRALVVVVKYPVEATIYRSGDLIERVSRDSLAGNIEDDTAAGDLFSAGFLAAFLAPQLASRAGALVGMELAAKKLVTVDRAEPSDLLRAASKLRLNE